MQEYEINSNKHVQNKDEVEQYVKNITYFSRNTYSDYNISFKMCLSQTQQELWYMQLVPFKCINHSLNAIVAQSKKKKNLEIILQLS